MATPNGKDLHLLSALGTNVGLATTEHPTFNGLVFALLALRSSSADADTQAAALSAWTNVLKLHLAPAEAGKALMQLSNRRVAALALQSWCAVPSPPGCRLSSPSMADAWRKIIVHRSTRHIVYSELSPTLWPCALAVPGGQGRYAELVRDIARRRRAWAKGRPVRDGASHMVARVSGKYESVHFGLTATWMDAVVFSAVCEDNLTTQMVADLQLAAHCYHWNNTKVNVANLLLRSIWRQPRPCMSSTSRMWLAAAAHSAVFGSGPLAHQRTLLGDVGYFTNGTANRSSLLAELQAIDVPPRSIPPAGTERAMRAMQVPHLLNQAMEPFMRVCCNRYAASTATTPLPNELLHLICTFLPPLKPLWSDHVFQIPLPIRDYYKQPVY